jgi:hypothetical protein
MTGRARSMSTYTSTVWGGKEAHELRMRGLIGCDTIFKIATCILRRPKYQYIYMYRCEEYAGELLI